MAARVAPTAIDPLDERGCPAPLRGQGLRSSAPAATDRFVPLQYAILQEARQLLLLLTEGIVGAEVSWSPRLVGGLRNSLSWVAGSCEHRRPDYLAPVYVHNAIF